MPQDIQPDPTSETVTERTGENVHQTTEADNAAAEIAVLAAEVEAGSEEIKQDLEEDISELDQEIRDLEEELQEARDNQDYPLAQEIEDDLWNAKADKGIASAELRALNEFGYVGSFSDRIYVPPPEASTGRNRYSAVINGEHAFLHHAEDTPISDFIVGELLTAPLAPLKALKWFNNARNAARIARSTRAARLLERLRGARQGLSRARTGRGRRTNRRERRRNNRCRRKSNNPVFLDTGAVSQVDPSFSFAGLFGIIVSSTYQSDINARGPLGWGRVSDLDATLERLPNTKLRYRDGAGFHVDFDRPTPNIGQWNPGDHIRFMEIAAGKDRTFMVREEGIVRYFRKYPDKKWYLSAIENQNGARQLFERDDQGMLIAIETPEYLRLEFTNDAVRLLRLSVDLVGIDGTRRTVMRYAYDQNDNLILAECPYGDKHEYGYDDRHLRIWAKINDQYEGRYHFDDEARCVLEETNGPYNGTRFEYDPERRITKHIPGGDTEKTEILYHKEDGAVFMDAHISGRIKHTYYDEEGYTSSEQDGNGHRTKFKYDPFGNVNRIEDPEGRISDFRWTEDGQMEYAIDPTGATWESDYDEFGNLIGTKDANGFDTQIKNNEMGQPTGICRHDGLIRFMSYSENHWLTSEIDFDGFETRFERDAFGRITSITEADERKTEYVYRNQEGWDFWTPSKVILQGRITLETDVIKPRREVCQIDGSGRETHFLIDGFGKIETTRDARGGVLKFRYDLAEELSEVENQAGQIWRFERDAMGRITRETDFGDSTIIYEYDDGDRLTASIYPDGTRHEIEMDKSGLMTKETVHAPSQDPLITEYEYDDRALLKSASNPDGKIEFERDANGQVTAEIINGTKIESTYDCCGRRESRRIGDEDVHLGYDAVGRLAGMTIGEHAPLEISRDTLGHEVERMSSAGFRLQQRFNALGLLTDQRIGHGIRSLADFAKSGTTAKSVVDRRYLWNKSLEPMAVSDNRWGETRYDYNPNGQITRTRFGDGAEERFSYDTRLNIDATAFRNRAAQQAQKIAERLQSWQGGQDGRVEKAQGAEGEEITLTYDVKGRVTEKRVEQNGFRPKSWCFEWNGLDRLTVVLTPEGSRWTYGYDAFARRLWKQEWIRGTEAENGIEKITWQQACRHDFLWDGDVIASEIITRADGAERKVNWYFEPDTFVPIARKEQGYLSYVVTDHLGTPREIVGETGSLEWAAEYRTWGDVKRLETHAPKSRSKPQTEHDQWGFIPLEADGNVALDHQEIPDQYYCPIRFQGQWEDQETGLYYNHVRYFLSSITQYISTDPIRLSGGLRTHGYIFNPIIGTDPFGLQAKFPSSMPTMGNYQRHHIIPWHLRNHPAIRKSGGLFNMGGEQNLMYLPECSGMGTTPQAPTNSGTHRGGTRQHRQYNQDMRRELDNIQRKGMDRRCTALAVRALALRYRTMLQTGAISLGRHGANCK